MLFHKNLGSVGRVQEKLSKILLAHFNLEKRPYYEFEDPRLRIVLLDRSTLNELLVYAGAVIYSERISKVVMKKDVLALKESIGEDMYFFASKKEMSQVQRKYTENKAQNYSIQ